jgi:nitrite reductase (NO-forming)
VAAQTAGLRPADRTGRVVGSHVIARRSLAAAGVFALIALVWAVVVLTRGGSWWGPIHAFLAGTVLLAISGASQMFTVTWAAAPAPPEWLARLQLGLVVTGVIAVLIGVPSGIDLLVWVGAIVVFGGLSLLALSIVRAVRRSLLRRFDLSARFYLTAFAAGALGVLLGGVLASGVGGDASTLRLVHYHLNLVGLVGFTIIGTLPTFLPTVAHHPAVSGREAIVAWWLCVFAALLFLSGLALPAQVVGVGSVVAGIAGAMVLAGIVWRLWDRGRSKTPFLQITAGVIWLIGWALVDGITLVSGGAIAPFEGLTGAVVVAGVGQVLLGSLAYLVPVLLGPPLSERMSTFSRRAAVPLVTANLAGIGLLAGLPVLAALALGTWMADFAWRLISQRALTA